MHYRLLIAIDVIEFMERLPSKTRKVLRNGIEVIGRLLQIAIVGDYAYTYWVDDADRHVKILDVHAADR